MAKFDSEPLAPSPRRNIIDDSGLYEELGEGSGIYRKGRDPVDPNAEGNEYASQIEYILGHPVDA